MSGRFWLIPRRALVPTPDEDSYAPISAFESETQAVIVRTTPRNDQAIMRSVAGLIAFSVFLMCVLPIERISTGPGRIMPQGGSLYLLPMDKVLVRSIVVRPGDIVRKGQVLALFDPTFAAADYLDAQKHVAADAALVARLEAEDARTPYIAKPGDPDGVLQLATYRQRHEDYQQNVADLEAKIATAQAALSGSRQDVTKFTDRVRIATDLLRRYQQLENSGYGAAVQRLAAQDTQVEDARLLGDAKSQEQENRHNLAAAQAMRADYAAQWFAATDASLRAARNNYADSTQNLTKYQRTHELVNLTAPQDGLVLAISQTSTGSVLDPSSSSATPLVTLTPTWGSLIAEVHIPSTDDSFVKPGQHVRLKLDAYKYVEYGTADGVVKAVSAGSFTLDQNNQPTDPYFKVFVTITGVHLRNVPKNFHLVPGQTLQGDIIIGHRTIMSYITDAVMRTGSEAFREP
jgi:hemolysin D